MKKLYKIIIMEFRFVMNLMYDIYGDMQVARELARDCAYISAFDRPFKSKCGNEKIYIRMDPMRVEIDLGDGYKLQSLEILGATYRGFEVKGELFYHPSKKLTRERMDARGLWKRDSEWKVHTVHSWIRFRKGYG